MSSWPAVTLKTLCESGHAELQTGPFGSQLHSYDYVSTGVSVVPTEAIGSRRINHENLPQISAQKAASLSRHLLRKGDILFARRGVQATGKTALVREAECGFLCGTGAIRLRLRTPHRILTPEYLSHMLSTSASIDWFKFHSIGATMPNLNEGIIKTFSFDLPPLSEQRTIATTLDALDDKIDLNRQMNETLEAMARAVFRDWFVEFNPTRAKAKGWAPYLRQDVWSLFPDQLESDGLPTGWKEVPLDSIACFLNGLALQKYPPRESTSLPVIKIAQLRSGSVEGADRASANLPHGYVIEDGDVLFSWSGSLLHRVWSAGRGALNQHLFKVSSRCYPKWFYYHWIGHHMPIFEQIASAKATTMGHIQRHHLTEARVVVPDDKVFKAADAIMGPLFDRAHTNNVEARTLRTTRDLLLPKLMSGELRVRDAERVVAGVL